MGDAEKICNEPHAPESHSSASWRIKNLANCPKCSAQTRNRTSCRNLAMKNGRCRMHGGKSAGPKTKEGLERSQKARLKHGRYSKEVKDVLRKIREVGVALKSIRNHEAKYAHKKD